MADKKLRKVDNDAQLIIFTLSSICMLIIIR